LFGSVAEWQTQRT